MNTYIVSSVDYQEPKNIGETLSCHSRDKWMNATEEKLDSMKSNKIWELVELKHRIKAMRYKLILKIKRNPWNYREV